MDLLRKARFVKTVKRKVKSIRKHQEPIEPVYNEINEILQSERKFIKRIYNQNRRNKVQS